MKYYLEQQTMAQNMPSIEEATKPNLFDVNDFPDVESTHKDLS